MMNAWRCAGVYADLRDCRGMSEVAAVALGSNIASAFGQPEQNLLAAIVHVGALGRIVAVSTFQTTAPVGFTAQPDFVNAALLLETELDPVELMRALLEIERTMGRDRSSAVAKGPRVIDLDLLLMGEAVSSTAELTLPHPAMVERRFVLEPLAEIAPEMRHPVLHCSVAELLARLC
jgi:2-amino-4-hydroxy-6-hydroxymethyldihydropteridine diphosphokinase